MRRPLICLGLLCVGIGTMAGTASGQTFGPTPLFTPSYGTATSPGGYVPPQVSSPGIHSAPREIAPGVPAVQPFPSGVGATGMDPNLPLPRRRHR